MKRTGRANDDQVLLFLDPVALCQLLEQRAIETPRRAVIDILDGSVVAQASVSQPRHEPPILTVGHLTVE